MKRMLRGKNRIAIAVLVAVMVLAPVVALADETDSDLHAGVGSFFAMSNDDNDGKETKAAMGAGVHTALTAPADDAALKEVKEDTDQEEASEAEDTEEDNDDLDMIETDQEEPVVQIVMANVSDAVNVRVEPSEDASIAGKLFANCGGTILEQKDGWTKLSSGELEGWTKDEYLLFGEEAEQLYNEVGKLEAKVATDGLRIRMEADEEAGVLDMVANGQVLTAIEDQGDWVSVKYEGDTGYVAAEFVELSFSVPTGKTMEQIAAEEKAKAEKEAAAAAEKKKKAGKSTTNRGAVAGAENEVMLLAALIQCEAGRECYEGKLAVGAVVMNRVRSGAYPGSISGVINQPSQFPPATNGRVASVLASGPSSDCIQAAQAAISGQSNVGGATHFGGSGSGIQIGNHNFW